jgi:hypothetical protein
MPGYLSLTELPFLEITIIIPFADHFHTAERSTPSIQGSGGTDGWKESLLVYIQR